MTNTTLLNPHLINLHLRLHHHLADSYPLFAHHLHISTTQARLGMHAAIDASFVFLVKQAQAPITPPIHPRALHLCPKKTQQAYL